MKRLTEQEGNKSTGGRGRRGGGGGGEGRYRGREEWRWAGREDEGATEEDEHRQERTKQRENPISEHRQPLATPQYLCSSTPPRPHDGDTASWWMLRWPPYTHTPPPHAPTQTITLGISFTRIFLHGRSRSRTLIYFFLGLVYLLYIQCCVQWMSGWGAERHGGLGNSRPFFAYLECLKYQAI